MKKDNSVSAIEKEKLKEQKKQERQKARNAKREVRKTKRELRDAEKDAWAQEKVMSGASLSEETDKTRKKLLHSKIFDLLWILNPQNLAKEVHVYGYNFSWKSHLLLLVSCILGISAIGFLFKLNTIYFIVNVIVVLIAIPSGVRYMYRQMYEQKRFTDVTTYMEQMLYSFQKNGKILSSLNETKELFEDGNMRLCIDHAIQYLEKGVSKKKEGLLREALSLIEERYACIKLTTVHELFVNSEEYGGDVENSILLLLEDVSEWKKRGFELQANKKKLNTDNIISIIVATALCYITLFVLDQMDNLFAYTNVTFDVFKISIIQLSSVVFILAMLWTFMKSFKKMTTNWLQSEDVVNEKMILSSYKTIVKYDEAKQRSKSILYAAPFAIITLVGFSFGKPWVGIAGIFVTIFMLQQHKVGYKIAMKDVNRALYMSLPQWFMQLAMLLQQNNVQVSLAKSIEDAPVVLRPELEKLMIRLANNPDKITSYTDFCKDFDVPETQSCMKMLHAIAESGVGNAQSQIANMIERVNDMQDIADQLKNEDIKFLMKQIFAYPVLAATVKLLIDMTIGMVYMMQMLSSMGGV